MKRSTWEKWRWWCCSLLAALEAIRGEKFTVGYLTGSERQAGDLIYRRPGRVISGAISKAVDDVNESVLGPKGHSLAFIVKETYGQEEISIREVAELWKENVSAFIGPQETCMHEGRMAAAFNLPMISYFCGDVHNSNKRLYPTFARTRPSDTDISRSVIAALTHFGFMHVVVVYLKDRIDDFSRLAQAINATARRNHITVHSSHVNSVKYLYENYTQNPFIDIVRETYKETRIYVSLGSVNEHIGLVLALDSMRLFDSGEYAVVGVDIETYKSENAAVYVSGVFNQTRSARELRAFRSFIAVAPSPSPSYQDFAAEVNRRLEMHPFNYTNPLGQLNKTKVIPVEAAWLYDAVKVYAHALLASLESGENATDGRAIAARMRNITYESVMGYTVHMDENGDVEGNYTLLSMDPDLSPGLYPLAVLHKQNPEVRFLREMKWPGGKPPLAVPLCGFHGEKCDNHVGPWTLGAACTTLALLALAALALYRGWRYEQELDSLLWKIDFKELQLPTADEQKNQKLSRCIFFQQDSTTIAVTNASTNTNTEKNGAVSTGVRSSQASLSSNPDLDFRYSAIFTEVAFYKGRLLAVKRVRRHHIDITRDIKKELKIMRDLQHDNINGFVGACIEPPNVCALSEYCTRGSLKDILENEDIKLDNMFIASLVGDIIRGMLFIHESPLQYHGALRPSNCLVDARWVVKLADFGLRAFRAGELPPTEPEHIKSHIEGLLYMSPELARPWLQSGGLTSPYSHGGSPSSDVYSFSLLLYELHTRRGPFHSDAPPPPTIIHRLAHTETPPYRPPVEPLSTTFDCVKECCVECWAEDPAARPDFKYIRTKLRPLRKGMKPNIFDNMIAMMEKYANNLEVLVDERTDQLQEEKKKTEALLEEMLPAPVADQLKKGKRVLPENYDSVTIYFSDIVGFTAMSAESTPLQVVDFLNDLYTCFDSIIENFDVYKVETIGDAYMVVSGLPIRNGIAHAGEIASMALALLAATQHFRVRHRPAHRLLLRIGIHSGPVCAGVVGLKMPRYCLFGDTVNTASRFESTGAPLKIHCSAACKSLLDQLGGYVIEERGIVAMKGKRDQLTYWVRGETPAAAARRARGASGPSQRSSLKNRHWRQPAALHRCCSLESPKKLRFASGHLLESHTDSVLHRRSDEYLMEMSCESGHLEAPLRLEPTSVSCPDIDPAPPPPSCHIKLVVNGRDVTDHEHHDVTQPLLGHQTV